MKVTPCLHVEYASACLQGIQHTLDDGIVICALPVLPHQRRCFLQRFVPGHSCRREQFPGVATCSIVLKCLTGISCRRLLTQEAHSADSGSLTAECMPT